MPARRHRDVHARRPARLGTVTFHARAGAAANAATGWCCSATCGRRWTTPTSCRCTTSPRSTCRPVRWWASRRCCAGTHPERGPIPPGEFIPLAEPPGSCSSVTATGPRAGRRARWRSGHRAGPVRRTAGRGEPVRAQPGRADARGVRRGPAGRLRPAVRAARFEVTETRDHRGPDAGPPDAGGADRPRRHGGRRRLRYRLHLDEPAGHDAAAHAQDRPLVRTTSTRDDGRPVLVKAIVDLAHEFGLSAVAEGVEDARA